MDLENLYYCDSAPHLLRERKKLFGVEHAEDQHGMMNCCPEHCVCPVG